MDKKIKFAVIGCGHIGKRHAEMVTRDPGAELVALCDIRPREELGIEAYDVPFFSSLTEFLYPERLACSNGHSGCRSRLQRRDRETDGTDAC